MKLNLPTKNWTDYKCNDQRTVNFSRPDVWTDGANIIIRKTSPFLGTVILTQKESKKVVKLLAIEMMKKQEQSRKFCPCCNSSLE